MKVEQLIDNLNSLSRGWAEKGRKMGQAALSSSAMHLKSTAERLEQFSARLAQPEASEQPADEAQQPPAN